MSHNGAYDNLTLRYNQKNITERVPEKLLDTNAKYIKQLEDQIEKYKADTSNSMASYYIKSYEQHIEKIKRQSEVWTV